MDTWGESSILLKKYLEDSSRTSSSSSGPSLCLLCHQQQTTSSDPPVDATLLATILIPCQRLPFDESAGLVRAVPVCSACHELTVKLTHSFSLLQKLHGEFCALRDEIGQKLISSFSDHVGLPFVDTLEKWNLMQKEVQYIYPHLIEEYLQSKSTATVDMKPDNQSQSVTTMIECDAQIKIEVDKKVDPEDYVDLDYVQDDADFDNVFVSPEITPDPQKEDVKLTKMTPKVIIGRLNSSDTIRARLRLKRPKIYISSDEDNNLSDEDDLYADGMSFSSKCSDSDPDDASSYVASHSSASKSRPKHESAMKNPSKPLNYSCTYCYRKFPRPYNLKRHEKTHFPSGSKDTNKAAASQKQTKKCAESENPTIFTCSHCDSSLSDHRAFHRHLLRVHLIFSEKDFKCPLCLKRYDQYHTRDRHVVEVHGVTLKSKQMEKDISSQFVDYPDITLFSVACYLCSDHPRFSSVAEMLSHEDSPEHKETVMQYLNIHCALCSIQFPTVEELQDHLKSSSHSEEVQKYSFVDKCTFCFVCKLSFESRKALSVHRDTNEHRRAQEDVRHNINFEKARRIVSSTVTEVNDGISNADGNLRYFCNKCEKSFARSSGLAVHLKAAHSTDGFTCEFCGKIFKTSRDFKSHRRSHLGEITKPFPCDKCEKSFLNKKSLEHHLEVHEGLTYQCEECGKIFQTPVFLKRHVKFSHTEDGKDAPQYSRKCSECPLMFIKPDQLRKHKVVTHPEVYLKDKPFYCKVCFKAFLTEEEINNEHIAAHDAHKCKICGKYFRRKRGLDKHMRVHTKERPFICTICAKGFVSQENLKEHTYIHSGERPFKCDSCDKGFIRSCKLKKHKTVCRGSVESK